MKKIFAILFCVLPATALIAQDCSNFAYLQKGKVIEITVFNGAGQVMRKQVNTVTDVTTSNSTTVATVSSEAFDRKGHSAGTKNESYKCSGGAFSVDMSGTMPQSVNAKMNTTYIEYPANMKVGDHFPDVETQMSMAVGGQTMNMTSKITGRTVAGKESVTTPAGTWDCFKITFSIVTTAQNSPTPHQTQITQWFAPNFGIVQFQVGAMMIKVTAVH